MRSLVPRLVKLALLFVLFIQLLFKTLNGKVIYMFDDLQTGSVNPNKLFIIEVVSFEEDIGHYWYEVTDFSHNPVINPATNLPLSDWDLEYLIETIKKICPDCGLFFNFFMDV